MNKDTKKVLYEFTHDDLPYFLVAVCGAFVATISSNKADGISWNDNHIAVYYIFFAIGCLIALGSLGMWWTMNIQRRLIQENAATEPKR